MFANLILIALTAFMGLMGMGLLQFKSWSDKKTGAALEAGKVNAVSAQAQARIAQAIGDAPKTQAGVVETLNAGRF